MAPSTRALARFILNVRVNGLVSLDTMLSLWKGLGCIEISSFSLAVGARGGAEIGMILGPAWEV